MIFNVLSLILFLLYLRMPISFHKVKANEIMPRPDSKETKSTQLGLYLGVLTTNCKTAVGTDWLEERHWIL